MSFLPHRPEMLPAASGPPTGLPPNGMAALKGRLKAVWMSGDYATFSQYHAAGGQLFLREVDPQPGERLLDVACGAGLVSLLASRAGAQVTGVDLTAKSIHAAQVQAAAEGLSAQFVEGDAEQLPFADASFDVVTSLNGAMFAPQPQRVAAELLRVCHPHGRVVMGSWVPGSFVAKMFDVLGQYLPASPAPPPLLWGDQAVVRERLGARVRGLHFKTLAYPLTFPFAPDEVVAFFKLYFGPVNCAFAALDEVGGQALRNDLVALWTQHNEAKPGSGATEVTSSLLVFHAQPALKPLVV